MTTITDATVRRLAELRPGCPVLSLYLDLDPSEFGTQVARASAIRSLLDDARREIERADADHAARAALRSDLERVERFFAGGEFSAKGTRGLAIFSGAPAGLFETIALGRPVETRVVVNDAPYVEPLLQAGDPRDWLVVLVNRRDARFFRGNAERLDEVGRLSDDVHRRHDQGGWSQANYERSIDNEVDQHVQRVAEDVGRRFRRAPFERLLVGGPEELVPRLEARLSGPVRERAAGRVDVDVPNASPDQVRAAAAPRFEADERRREREALDRLAQGVGSGPEGAGRAVAGLEAVLDALEQRRVEILLYDEGYAPPGKHVLEAAVEAALAQAAQVLPVRHHPDLGPLGGIGAVLRF
jgi:peptide subunit release factor 1 (eRF1)